jgi:hypothetical protein
MAGLVPAIHVLLAAVKDDVDARDIGERSDAVLRTAMRGHDAGEISPSPWDYAPRRYCGWTPASRTTLPHLAVSLAMNAPKPAGVMRTS